MGFGYEPWSWLLASRSGAPCEVERLVWPVRPCADNSMVRILKCAYYGAHVTVRVWADSAASDCQPARCARKYGRLCASTGTLHLRPLCFYGLSASTASLPRYLCLCTHSRTRTRTRTRARTHARTYRARNRAPRRAPSACSYGDIVAVDITCHVHTRAHVVKMAHKRWVTR